MLFSLNVISTIVLANATPNVGISRNQGGEGKKVWGVWGVWEVWGDRDKKENL